MHLQPVGLTCGDLLAALEFEENPLKPETKHLQHVNGFMNFTNPKKSKGGQNRKKHDGICNLESVRLTFRFHVCVDRNSYVFYSYWGVGLNRLMWKEVASYERLPCRSLPWDIGFLVFSTSDLLS